MDKFTKYTALVAGFAVLLINIVGEPLSFNEFILGNLFYGAFIYPILLSILVFRKYYLSSEILKGIILSILTLILCFVLLIFLSISTGLRFYS